MGTQTGKLIASSGKQIRKGNKFRTWYNTLARAADQLTTESGLCRLPFVSDTVSYFRNSSAICHPPGALPLGRESKPCAAVCYLTHHTVLSVQDRIGQDATFHHGLSDAVGLACIRVRGLDVIISTPLIRVRGTGNEPARGPVTFENGHQLQRN